MYRCTCPAVEYAPFARAEMARSLIKWISDSCLLRHCALCNARCWSAQAAVLGDSNGG